MRAWRGIHNESLMSSCRRVVDRTGWALTPVGGQALIRSHGPPEGSGPWGRQVIIRTPVIASAMRQPVVIGSDPTHLKGLGVDGRTVSLLPLVSGKANGGTTGTATRNRDRPADSISSTGVSPSDRMRGHTALMVLPAGYGQGRSDDSLASSEAIHKGVSAWPLTWGGDSLRF